MALKICILDRFRFTLLAAIHTNGSNKAIHLPFRPSFPSILIS